MRIHWGLKEGRFRNSLGFTRTKGSLFRGDMLHITMKKESLLEKN